MKPGEEKKMTEGPQTPHQPTNTSDLPATNTSGGYPLSASGHWENPNDPGKGAEPLHPGHPVSEHAWRMYMQSSQ